MIPVSIFQNLYNSNQPSIRRADYMSAFYIFLIVLIDFLLCYIVINMYAFFFIFMRLGLQYCLLFFILLMVWLSRH